MWSAIRGVGGALRRTREVGTGCTEAEPPTKMSSGSRSTADPTPGEPPDMLRLIPLPCPTEPSFPLDHLYLEVVYGPLLGPAAVAVGRHLGRCLAASGKEPVRVVPVQVALEVGLRSASVEPLGRRSHLRHALDRLDHCRLVRWLGPGDLGILTEVPALSPSVLSRLPSAARIAHVSFVDSR